MLGCAFPLTEHCGRRGRPSRGGFPPAAGQIASLPPPSSPHSVASTHSVRAKSPWREPLNLRDIRSHRPPSPLLRCVPLATPRGPASGGPSHSHAGGTSSGNQRPPPQPQGQPGGSAVTTPLTRRARTRCGEHVSPGTCVGGPGRWAAKISQGTALPRTATSWPRHSLGGAKGALSIVPSPNTSEPGAPSQSRSSDSPVLMSAWGPWGQSGQGTSGTAPSSPRQGSQESPSLHRWGPWLKATKLRSGGIDSDLH